MRMYFMYIKQQLKISMQYRSATFMMMFVSIFSSLATVFGIYLLFTRFSNIGGYTFEHVLITYSVVLLVFSLCELLFRGYDLFDTLVISGDLDKMFLRPRSMFLQVLGHKMEFGKLGRVFFGLLILIYAATTSGVAWDPLKIFTLCLMVISGVIIFLGIFLLSSSFTIFSVQGVEFVNIFTNGGRELSSYPLDIYKKAIKNFFTFIIPFASFNYLPLQYILGNQTASIFGNMLTPVYGMLFVIPCYFVFKWSLTKYTSSGT